MKYQYHMMNIKYSLILITFFIIHSSCIENDKYAINKYTDVLELIYSVADELDMKVISDFNLQGGNLYQKKSVEELIGNSNKYIEEYYDKYGKHASFWGWYLNNEINPIENSDHEQSDFWRTIWKSMVNKCHVTAPGTKVTISPFFLLDKESYRGFKYLEPIEYEEWWYNTMKETDIDILMLQDSGAEHLSFFTLNDRRPFFQAFANACRRAGKEFWINVETGQVEARDWTHALQMERDFKKDWVFTEIDWLKQKLELAAEYATGIVNWGYFPLMNPMEECDFLSINDIDGQKVDLSKRKANYNAYKEYVETVPETIPDGMLVRPIINGTLWFLPPISNAQSKEQMREAVKNVILCQKNLGFDFLWICNTPYHFKKKI